METSKEARNRRERERAALRRYHYRPTYCEYCGRGCSCPSCTKPVEIALPGGTVTVKGDFVWDHRDKTTKRRSLGRMWGSASDSAIKAELAKCRPLCRMHNSSGERNGEWAIDPTAVREIRRRARAGDTHANLAARFGISPRQVGYIASGEAWTESALQAAEREIALREGRVEDTRVF